MKPQGSNGLVDVTSELLSTSWSDENLFFDLNSPGSELPVTLHFSVLHLTVYSFRRGLLLSELGFRIDSRDVSKQLSNRTSPSRSG